MKLVARLVYSALQPSGAAAAVGIQTQQWRLPVLTLTQQHQPATTAIPQDRQQRHITTKPSRNT